MLFINQRFQTSNRVVILKTDQLVVNNTEFRQNDFKIGFHEEFFQKGFMKTQQFGRKRIVSTLITLDFNVADIIIYLYCTFGFSI